MHIVTFHLWIFLQLTFRGSFRHLTADIWPAVHQLPVNMRDSRLRYISISFVLMQPLMLWTIKYVSYPEQVYRNSLMSAAVCCAAAHSEPGAHPSSSHWLLVREEIWKCCCWFINHFITSRTNTSVICVRNINPAGLVCEPGVRTKTGWSCFTTSWWS